MTSTVTDAPPATRSAPQPTRPEPAPAPDQPTPAPIMPGPPHKAFRPTLSQILWIGALLCVAAGLLWLTWPRPKPVETAVIGTGPVHHDIVDEGRTRIHDVFIVAAPVSGDLQRIDVEPGDAVTAGETVAEIQPAAPLPLDARTAAETEAVVAAAAAAVRAAVSDLALASHNQQRTRVLFDKGYASQAALDTVDSAADAARAALAARRADLRRAEVAATTPSARVGHVTAIHSPGAGRVLQLRQQSESVVAAGTPLLDIGDPANLEIVAEFLSQDAVQMNIGDRAFIEGWGGAPIAAHITLIEPSAHTKVSALGVEEQRVNVLARPDDPRAAPVLGHGFRVDLRVVISEAPQAVRVPVDALVRNGENWTVFRLDGHKVRQTTVEVGAGDDYRPVLSGLKPGDRVVVYPGDTLKSGDSVTATTQPGT